MKNVYWLAGGVVLAAVAYAYFKTRDLVPPVVAEGLEASGILAGLAFDAVTDPLDTFGIYPGKNVYGVTKWAPTLPWENTNDPVSNNDSGINFNYF